MTYTIPYIPPSMNKYKGRSNIWEWRKDKTEWEQLVKLFCRPAPKEPVSKCVLIITYYFKSRQRRDPNNYDGQFITDGLVKSGIIVDDDFKHIELVLRGGYDKKNPRTEICIKETLNGNEI